MSNGHYGCPQCGSKDFTAWQNVTEYNSQKILCAFNDDADEGDEEFEEVDYLDTQCGESEGGSFDDEKVCDKCGHKYTDPAYYPGHSFTDDLEASTLDPHTIEALTTLLAEKAPHASDFTLEEKPHALIVHVKPEKKQMSRRTDHWTVELCPRCKFEASELFPRTEELRDGKLSLENDPVLRDGRALPVLLVIPLCRHCHPQAGR